MAAAVTVALRKLLLQRQPWGFGPMRRVSHLAGIWAPPLASLTPPPQTSISLSRFWPLCYKLSTAEVNFTQQVIFLLSPKSMLPSKRDTRWLIRIRLLGKRNVQPFPWVYVMAGLFCVKVQQSSRMPYGPYFSSNTGGPGVLRTPSLLKWHEIAPRLWIGGKRSHYRYTSLECPLAGALYWSRCACACQDQLSGGMERDSVQNTIHLNLERLSRHPRLNHTSPDSR